MKLSNEIKQNIIDEYNSFKCKMYADRTLEERQELDQFFTPAEITIDMIEEYSEDSLENKNILDPTCGSGNLLAACLIAGADPDKVFGNEYDPVMVELCRTRLKSVCNNLGKQGFQDWQIHQGNALIEDCIVNFGDDYDKNILSELVKRRVNLKGGFMENPEYYVRWKKEHTKNKIEAVKLEQVEAEQADMQTEDLGW